MKHEMYCPHCHQAIPVSSDTCSCELAAYWEALSAQYLQWAELCSANAKIIRDRESITLHKKGGRR